MHCLSDVYTEVPEGFMILSLLFELAADGFRECTNDCKRGTHSINATHTWNSHQYTPSEAIFTVAIFAKQSRIDRSNSSPRQQPALCEQPVKQLPVPSISKRRRSCFRDPHYRQFSASTPISLAQNRVSQYLVEARKLDQRSVARKSTLLNVIFNADMVRKLCSVPRRRL